MASIEYTMEALSNKFLLFYKLKIDNFFSSYGILSSECFSVKKSISTLSILPDKISFSLSVFAFH